MTEDDLCSLVGANIRARRSLMGLSREALAELADLSSPLISMVESGKRFISARSLLAIGRVLKMDPKDFFDNVSLENDQGGELLGQLLRLFAAVDDDQRKLILGLVEVVVKNKLLTSDVNKLLTSDVKKGEEE
jgi:transcriptional regulator with XRE-family HTH domain